MLFINKNGYGLTRSGVRFRINVIVKEAARTTPTLSEKNITSHTFMHSVAMNLLTSGVDISTIAIWLRHSSIETTHKYMVADMELKRKAMEKAGSAGNSSYNYKPSAICLAFWTVYKGTLVMCLRDAIIYAVFYKKNHCST